MSLTLDLAQAEGIADLIEADTEFQRRQALRQLEGYLSRQVEAWRQKLIEVGAQVEAELDFSDEGDVAAVMTASIIVEVARLRDEMRHTLRRAGAGERLRDGLRAAFSDPGSDG